MTMLFSVLLASVLWFLVIINQMNHQSSYTLPISVRNLPENVDFDQPIPSEIKVEIKGLGVDLLVQHFQFRPDTVFFSYLRNRNFILTQDYFSQIKQKTPASAYTQLLRISPDTIPIQFEYRKQKKIPLISRLEPVFPPNYQQEQARIIQPDSVTITGSEKILDSVSSWFTIEKKVEVKKDKERFIVSIDTLAGIKVSPSRAIVEVSSQAYTQKSLTVKLEVLDSPEGINVKLTEERLALNCLVPLQKFDEIPNNLTLAIAYKDLNQEVSYFMPEVEQILPERVKVITRQPLYISYVIEEKIGEK